MSDWLNKIAITKIPKVGPIIARNLISYCGGVDAVFQTKKSALEKVPGVGPKTAATIAENLKTIVWPFYVGSLGSRFRRPCTARSKGTVYGCAQSAVLKTMLRPSSVLRINTPLKTSDNVIAERSEKNCASSGKSGHAILVDMIGPTSNHGYGTVIVAEYRLHGACPEILPSSGNASVACAVNDMPSTSVSVQMRSDAP